MVKSDNKTVYRGKDYPVHSSGPWSVSAGIAPDPKGRLIVEDCHGNPVCATSARGVQGAITHYGSQRKTYSRRS